jgi:hypothetical protein
MPRRASASGLSSGRRKSMRAVTHLTRAPAGIRRPMRLPPEAGLAPRQPLTMKPGRRERGRPGGLRRPWRTPTRRHRACRKRTAAGEPLDRAGVTARLRRPTDTKNERASRRPYARLDRGAGGGHARPVRIPAGLVPQAFRGSGSKGPVHATASPPEARRPSRRACAPACDGGVPVTPLDPPKSIIRRQR